MSLDTYSLCPGGTGKKIKFCCSDLLPDLQKIERMMDGEQYLACLKHVDHLLERESNRDRACLLATRCLLLRVTEQYAAARRAAADFLAKHPDNSIALTESALMAIDDDLREALDLMLRAVAAGTRDGLMPRTYEALGIIAAALLDGGFYLPGRALLHYQADLNAEDDRPIQLLAELSHAADTPLLLRVEWLPKPCPADAPWKDRFEQALEADARGEWRLAAERFAALAAEFPDAQAAWWNLAVFRTWLADDAGAAEALRKYAALRAAELDGLDDAVEAEARAMLLNDDPLGDRRKMFHLAWTVENVEAAMESLQSEPAMFPMPFDPAHFGDGETPPQKAAFLLLDRPMPESAEGLTFDAMPKIVCHILLYGRQTDREARLEAVNVSADDLSAVLTAIRQAAGKAVAPQANQEVSGSQSAPLAMLRPSWMPPKGFEAERIRAMIPDYLRDVVLHRWPERKLGVLGGRSIRDAAADPAMRVRCLAVILVLEYWIERMTSVDFDINDLRIQCGLPACEPIDPAKQPMKDIPPTRLDRLPVEKLSDDELVTAFLRAGAYAIRPVVRKFAQEVLARPSLAEHNARLNAYLEMARTERNASRAIEYIGQGRAAALKKKKSCAAWDLLEIPFRFAQCDGREAVRLIEHLQTRHANEPGGGETLAHILIEVGLLYPDGTPAYPPAGPASAMPDAMEPESEAPKLWTPESAVPAAGGKLWTPE